MTKNFINLDLGKILPSQIEGLLENKNNNNKKINKKNPYRREDRSPPQQGEALTIILQ